MRWRNKRETTIDTTYVFGEITFDALWYENMDAIRIFGSGVNQAD